MNIIDDMRNSIYGNIGYLNDSDEYEIEMASYDITDSNSYIVEVINEFESVEESIVDKAKETGGNVVNKIKELWKKFKAWVKNLVRVVTNLFLSGEKIVKKYGSQIKSEYARKKNALDVKTYVYDVDINKIDGMVNKLIDDEAHRNESVKQDQDDFNKSVITCIRNDKEVNKLSEIPLDKIINLLSNGKNFIKSIKNMEKKMDGKFKELINKLNKTDNNNAEMVSNAKKMSSMTSRMFSSLIREIKSGVRAYTGIVRKLLNDKYKGVDGEPDGEDSKGFEEYDKERKDSITDDDKGNSDKKLNTALEKEKKEQEKKFREAEDQEEEKRKTSINGQLEDLEEDLKKQGLKVDKSVIRNYVKAKADLEFYNNITKNSAFAYLGQEDREFYIDAEKEMKKKLDEYEKEYRDAVKEAEEKQKEEHIKNQSDYLTDMKKRAKNRKNFDEEKFQQMLNDDKKDDKKDDELTNDLGITKGDIKGYVGKRKKMINNRDSRKKEEAERQEQESKEYKQNYDERQKMVNKYFNSLKVDVDTRDEYGINSFVSDADAQKLIDERKKLNNKAKELRKSGKMKDEKIRDKYLDELEEWEDKRNTINDNINPKYKDFKVGTLPDDELRKLVGAKPNKKKIDDKLKQIQDKKKSNDIRNMIKDKRKKK